jgi:hypothetical protein
MKLYEVFYPTTGRTIYTVPFVWLARLICKRNGCLDWAPKGEGWS